METLIYKQITDYENALNSYHFQLRKDTYCSETYDNFNDEMENIPTSLNENLYNYEKNFNLHSRLLLLNILDLFNCLDNYKNPNIDTQKRNLQDYKSVQINRISEYEYQVKAGFESLNLFPLHIQALITENQFLDAYSLRNYIMLKLGCYKNYLSAFGIDIDKTPFADYFNDLSGKIENSINTEELKFINDLQKNTQPKPTETPEIEPKTTTPFTTPEKIALLQVTDLEKHFDRLTGDIADQKYRLLSTLFGVSFDTVKKCYINNTVNLTHKKRATDFYNNKFNES